MTTTTEPRTRPALHQLLAQRWSPRAFDPTAELSPDTLDALLEAARWAPSASNSQPWRFLPARRGSAAFDTLLAALRPANQDWAGDAGALLLVAAATTGPDGAPQFWAAYDAGQAVAHLTVQAQADGLAVRQMGGFDAAPLQAALALSDGVVPLVIAAIGVPSAADVPADHPARRLGPRTRRPLDDLLIDHP